MGGLPLEDATLKQFRDENPEEYMVPIAKIDEMIAEGANLAMLGNKNG